MKLDPISSQKSPVDAEIAALSARIGEQVLSARKEAGLSRRVLSKRSGVSQRYLAQIEAGDGNISIALLVKLGRALAIPIETFFTRDENEAPFPDPQSAHRVALIGLRGAGKSTLGQRMGDTFEIPFIELNEIIEQESGLSTADVIAMYGPEGYRAFEHRALEQVINNHERIVLAVAGGIVSAGETFDLVLKNFTTVWLQASPDEHMTRVRKQGDERPMAGNPKALDDLRSILGDREQHYARADAILNTSGRSLSESERDLSTLLQAHGF